MYPESEKVLHGVAQFLKGPAAAAISDKGVAFRLKLAASLVDMVARELAASENTPLEGPDLEEVLSAPLDAELVRRTRQALETELKVVAPRFDLRLEVEEPA